MWTKLIERLRNRALPCGLALVTLISLFGLRYIWFNNRMWFDLENHDTRVLLQTIRGEQQPFKWFTSDWPLYNGFYRPLPALSFEIDDRLYGNNLPMYCFTNWWISLFCAFGVVWLVYELFRRKGPAIAAGCIFAAWQTGIVDYIPFEWAGGIIAAAALLVGGLWGGGWKTGLVAAALTLFAARELSNSLDVVDIVSMDLSYRAIGWPVGRTATMAAMFILPCVAAYCRWERNRKGSFAALSLVSLVLAMMCYEQVIVVPALLLGTAVALRLQGVAVRWAWHLIPWGILGAYALMHSQLLPKTRYQDQAYRGTGGGVRDMLLWIFPASFELKFLPTFFTREIGIYVVFIERFWRYLVQVVSGAVSYFSFKRHWLPIAYGLLASAGAFAPMAFQQPLVHYNYLPMAFRTPFVVWLIILAWENLRETFRPRQSAS